ncbi:MAG: DUF2520 domain-containing protein [Calditrichaeota bacterium]|nr:MAG: DUF2520 domain-containing protein [Calditrichota bacterium]
MLTKAEIPKQYHWAAFQGLMESTIQNLSHHSPAEALTGPMVRGDVNTIRKHLEFLKEKLPEGIPPYLALLDSVLERFPLPGEIKEQLLKLSHEYRNTER